MAMNYGPPPQSNFYFLLERGGQDTGIYGQEILNPPPLIDNTPYW